MFHDPGVKHGKQALMGIYRESEKYFIFLIHVPGVKPEKQALMGVYRETLGAPSHPAPLKCR
jgi:hypothetical protein